MASFDGFASALTTDRGLASSSRSNALYQTLKVIDQLTVGQTASHILASKKAWRAAAHCSDPRAPLRAGQYDDLNSLSSQPTGRASKRQKPNETRMAFPRKRAVAACQLCRSRKVCIGLADIVMVCSRVQTKCDNQRPFVQLVSFSQGAMRLSARKLGSLLVSVHILSTWTFPNQAQVRPSKPYNTRPIELFHTVDGRSSPLCLPGPLTSLFFLTLFKLSKARNHLQRRPRRIPIPATCSVLLAYLTTILPRGLRHSTSQRTPPAPECFPGQYLRAVSTQTTFPLSSLIPRILKLMALPRLNRLCNHPHLQYVVALTSGAASERKMSQA